MKDKTKDELMNELAKLRGQIAELEIQHKQVEEVIRKSERNYQDLFENIIDGIIVHKLIVDENGNPVDYILEKMNNAAEKILSWKKEEIEGKRTTEVYSGDTPFIKRYAKVAQTGEPEYFIDYYPRFGKWYEIASFCPKKGYFANIFRDITERKQKEKEIQKLNQFQKIVIDNANIWLDVLDKKLNIIVWNKAAEKISGYSRDEVVGHNKIWEWLYPDEEYRKKLMAAENVIISKGGRMESSETTIRCKDGKTKIISWYSRNLVDESGALIGSLVLGSDITERKRREEQLTYIATHDTLTGLPNRFLFDDRLSLAMVHAHRKKQKLTVMMFDLDWFKNINDSLGHRIGDKLLQAVGSRLRSFLRESDTIARMGGDEFLLLLPETARVEDAIKVAQKILEEIRKPFVVDKHKLNIAVSIGIAIFPNDGEDTDTLISHADIAMYRVKKAGRNGYQLYTAQL